MGDNDNLKDAQVSHWDLDYMTDAQREQWLAEQDRTRHVDAARKGSSGRQASSALADAPTQSGEPAIDWRWTGVAALVVAALTGVVWLFTIGPLA